MVENILCKKSKQETKASTKITLGTKEWADSNVNCFLGCKHDCRYCYAKKMALRFGRADKISWKEMSVRNEIVQKNFHHREGRIMFPTSHDILPDPDILEPCMKVIGNLLQSGTKLLITTKPHLSVIQRICKEFSDKKDLIQFRFTITTNKNNLIEFWEPGAPKYEERISALKYAFRKGFKTSLSVEPFLSDPREWIESIQEFVTESIWVGPMNYVAANGLSESEQPFYTEIRKIGTPFFLIDLFNSIKDNPKIRFKDALTNRLEHAGLLE